MAIGVYGWMPETFWRATPLDFWLAHDGRVREADVKRRAGVPRMTRADYDELKERIRAKGIEV